MKTIRWWLLPFRLTIIGLALYGACRLWGDYHSSNPSPQYEAEFIAGVHDVGPEASISWRQVTQLAKLNQHQNATWALHWFPDAAPSEVAIFLDVVADDGYPLVRFRLVNVAVELHRGPLPASFKETPAPGTLAAR